VSGNETTSNIFTAGPSFDGTPAGDAARQAIASLRGYAYQIAASVLAWLDLQDNDRLYLEVAEDYAIVASDALKAIQVKDSRGSGSITLNSPSVRSAIAAYVDLVERNPSRTVQLRFLTTSPVGIERDGAQQFGREQGLVYWRKAARGGDAGPLRTLLQSDVFPEGVQKFVGERDDEALRRDLLRNVHWDCSQPDLPSLRQELESSLIVFGAQRYQLPAIEGSATFRRINALCSEKDAGS